MVLVDKVVSKMVQLGFSIYPEQHSIDKMMQYIDLLKRYDAQRVFISLIQIDSDDHATFDKYKQLIQYTSDQGIRVIADISPDFIKQNGWSDQLLSKAKEFGLSGIRLDEALPIEEIVMLTHNSENIKIELNMSTDANLLMALIEQKANLANIIACHNFYPHRYTGLSKEHFMKMSNIYRQHGIETAAFVNARSASQGPWPLTEGLCTLEEHRDAHIDYQVEFLKATGVIDNIIIANQFIDEDELRLMQQAIQASAVQLKIEVNKQISPVEKQIIQYAHIYRGDISAYVIRSTQPRIAYKNDYIGPITQNKMAKRGSIIIDNDLYERYKGELQIALMSFDVGEKANIVGEIIQEYLPILEVLQPWQAFRLVIVEP